VQFSLLEAHDVAIMVERQFFRAYEKAVYEAPSLDAAIDVVSDTAEKLGFRGASCVFWPRAKQSAEEAPPPPIRLSGSNLGPAAQAWNANYIKHGLFRCDFVYRACQVMAIPFVWSYDSLPEIVPDVDQKTTIGEARGIEHLLKTTGFRGGISVPLRAPGGYFGYVGFVSTDHLKQLMALREDCSDHLLGITYHFYHAIADKLILHEARNKHLTPRQLQCLKLIAIGKTLDETAEILGLSYSTVRFHLKCAETSLGTRNRANTIRKAASLGVLGDID
jgi:DNA-binding CsgD family transcriptional regulator